MSSVCRTRRSMPRPRANLTTGLRPAPACKARAGRRLVRAATHLRLIASSRLTMKRHSWRRPLLHSRNASPAEFSVCALSTQLFDRLPGQVHLTGPGLRLPGHPTIKEVERPICIQLDERRFSGSRNRSIKVRGSLRPIPSLVSDRRRPLFAVAGCSLRSENRSTK